MRKEILSIILAIVMMVSILPVSVYAEDKPSVTVKEIASGLEYDYIKRFSEGVAAVLKGAEVTSWEIIGGKYGYIDKTGKLVVPVEYDFADMFSEGLALVMKDEKYGFIDNTGKTVIPLEYTYAWSFSEGLALASNGGKTGYIDKTGKTVLPFEYSSAQKFSEGLAAVQKGDKWGYIDKTGNIVIQYEYTNAWQFSDGVAVVRKNGKAGCIDKTGKVVVPFEYDSIETFSDGLASVWKDGMFGYIDKTGKVIMPLEYDYAQSFSEGLGAVRIGNAHEEKWGFIDKTGKIVIPIEYDNFDSFHEGLAQFAKDGKNGYIDKTGKIVVPPEYEWSNRFNGSLAAGKKDGKWSILQITSASVLTATPISATVTFNGKETIFNTYEIDGENYFKLRDVAYTLSGTANQFEVIWDSSKNAINLTSGKVYTPVGGEMSDRGTEKKTPVLSKAKIYLDGKEVTLTAYQIEGNNYFRLNDMENALDLNKVKRYLEENYDKVKIDGSTSMIPLHQSINDLFSSNMEAVTHNKTVEAFEKLISGKNDILLGVDYSDELLEKAKSSGVDLVKKEITREAFVFLINKNNSVKSLTIEQIKEIYSGKITNWKEVGGDDAPIKAYQRNSDSGSQIRMNKFMGDIKLTENEVEYLSTMGNVVEQISNYDDGKYSIAYNMYTFTEKQYTNDEVILLAVNGVHPDDETIFNETYPITIYNYIYCDKNNVSVNEFTDNLYSYLMSEEGQKLISGSGYINLNISLDRNKDIDPPYDSETEYGMSHIGFYNEEKGEYYDAGKDGELLIFNSFVDYVLRDTKYKDNEKAKDFLTSIVNSDIPKNPSTARIYEEGGIITFDPWFTISLDPEVFFNFIYDGLYYSNLKYYIDEDKYVLTAIGKDTFDNYLTHGDFKYFSKYADDYIPDAVIEITKEDLKKLYMRTTDYISINADSTPQDGIELKFFQPFK